MEHSLSVAEAMSRALGQYASFATASLRAVVRVTAHLRVDPAVGREPVRFCVWVPSKSLHQIRLNPSPVAFSRTKASCIR